MKIATTTTYWDLEDILIAKHKLERGDTYPYLFLHILEIYIKSLECVLSTP